MKKSKLLIAGALAAALFAISITAAAGDFGGRGAGKGQLGIGIQRLFKGLDLTDSQRAQIKGILQSNESEILAVSRDVVEGRLEITKGNPDAAPQFAAALVQANALKTQIVEQIKPVLTPEQLSKFNERLQLREKRLQRTLDRLNARIAG